MLRLLVLICVSLTFTRSAGTASPASAPVQSKAAVDRESLSIGRVTLRLGTPKDAVLSDLGKYYFSQRYEPSTESFDNWLILDKVKREENLGALRFRAGKLTLARKEWTHEEKEYSGADTVEMIYKLTSEFESKGNVSCIIRTFSSVQQTGPGGVEFRETEITCGHRQIELMLSWQAGPAWVQVSESIVDEAEMVP